MAMKVRYEQKEYKSILNKYKFIDGWFWCRYGINTYSGCEFACTYCDSRSHKYHLHTDFDQVIYAKKNAAEMLDGRIRRARTLLPDVVVMSGAGDPYQPVEEKYGNTRACLEVLERHRYPVHIITKSTLVTKDLDVLSKIARNNWCAVSVTITTTDDEVSRFLEPRAPLPAERFEALRRIKKEGKIFSGITLMPIVPFLEDGGESLENIAKAARDADVDYILFAGGMTMRDRQAEWYLRRLGEEYPELVPRYLELYDAEMMNGKYSGRYGPPNSYSAGIHRKMFELCEKYGLSYRMPRFIPDDFRRENYIIAEELLVEAYVAQSLGKPWTNVHWAGQNINNLKEPIRSIAGRGELRGIRNVNRELEKRIMKRLDELEGEKGSVYQVSLDDVLIDG